MPFLDFSSELRLDVEAREPVPPHLPLDFPLPALLLVRVTDVGLVVGGVM